MVASDWRSRISIDRNVHRGEPCIRGTRVPVRTVVNCLANGDTLEEVLGAWPQLRREDVQAALYFASEAVATSEFIPIETPAK